MVTQIMNKNFILFVTIIICLPVNYVIPQYQFWKIINGTATQFQYNSNDPDNNWDDILIWESSKAANIPFKYENWTWIPLAVTVAP